MTGFATTNVGDGSFGVVAGDAPRADKIPLPRFTLRKRKANANSEREAPVCLPSVNSALLSNLFADVAEIQQPKQNEEALPTLGVSPPAKKSRHSLSHSVSRSPKSFKCLADALFPSADHLSSTQVPESSSPDDLTRQVTPESSPSPNVISLSKVMEACAKVPSLSTKPSFPHLPPTVSISSCNTLSRVNSNLHESAAEKEEKDAYGWFIEMEEEGEEKEQVDPYHKSASSNNLAFVASTAPKADNHDAEVEWAKAADTVDSVLGDFF